MKSLEHLSFRIRPVPPFRLDLTAWALRRRRENIVDRWNGLAYRRVHMIEGFPIEVGVSQTGSSERSTLQVSAKGEKLSPDAKGAIVAALERMLGLRLDLKDFYAFAGVQGRLFPLVGRFRGVKPPRFPTLFEAAAGKYRGPLGRIGFPPGPHDCRLSHRGRSLPDRFSRKIYSSGERQGRKTFAGC